MKDGVPEDLTEPFDPETGIGPPKATVGERDGQEVGSDTRHKRLQLLVLRHGVGACEATMASEHRQLVRLDWTDSHGNAHNSSSPYQWLAG